MFPGREEPGRFHSKRAAPVHRLQLEYMDKRVRFIVEESTFFKTNFLVTEGFVKQENFTGMFRRGGAGGML
jgi:hypothetical protein